MEKRGRGRPKLDPRGGESSLMAIRATAAERKAYGRAAKKARLTLSQWIRDHLGDAAGLPRRKDEEPLKIKQKKPGPK